MFIISKQKFHICIGIGAYIIKVITAPNDTQRSKNSVRRKTLSATFV